MKKNIVIIWWWTSWWLTALYLSHKIDSKKHSIKLISSESLWTIWVWESTIPDIRSFISDLWITESELLASTNGTIKMGIKFENWNPKKTYNHPFTWWLTSYSISNKSFSAWFTKYFPNLNYDKYADIWEKFFESECVFPSSNKSISYDYAYHLDANLLAQLLKEKAVANGVEYIDSYIDWYNESNGFITFLKSWKKEYKCDIIFDCSWFNSKILSRNQSNRFVSYSDELLCDTALFWRSSGDEKLPCYTLSSAMSCWWRWRIPLKNMYWNWYVFSSKFQDIEDAKKEFSKASGILIKDMRLISFNPWYNTCSWYKNSISIWLSAWFVEPLEATWIFFSTKQLRLLDKYVSNGSLLMSEANSREYNTKLSNIFEEVKNFIVFHYFTSPKSDSDFWNYYKRISNFSDSFKKISTLMKKRFPDSKFSESQMLFKSESWIRIMIWNNWTPDEVEKIDIDIRSKILKIILLHQNKINWELKYIHKHREYLLHWIYNQ